MTTTVHVGLPEAHGFSVPPHPCRLHSPPTTRVRPSGVFWTCVHRRVRRECHRTLPWFRRPLDRMSPLRADLDTVEEGRRPPTKVCHWSTGPVPSRRSKISHLTPKSGRNGLSRGSVRHLKPMNLKFYNLFYKRVDGTRLETRDPRPVTTLVVLHDESGGDAP